MMAARRLRNVKPGPNLPFRRPILFTILVVILMVVLFIIGDALAYGIVGTSEGPKALFFSQLPLVLVFVWLATRTAGSFGFFTPIRWESPALLLVPSVLIVFVGLGALSDPDLSQFGWKLAGNMMIGAFEEAALRGVVLVVLARAWGATSAGMARSVVVSSSVFGLLHLFQLGKQPVVPVLLQVVYATFIGVCFAGVLIRTRALLGLIVIHGLIDFVGSLQKNADAPATVSSALVACAATLPFAVAGLWLIRNRTINTTLFSGVEAAVPSFSEDIRRFETPVSAQPDEILHG